MKQIYIETTTQSSGIRNTATLEKPKNLRIAATGIKNIFLEQNMGKGPPGRTRSPVAFNSMPRIILFHAFTMNYNHQLFINQIYFTQFLNF